MYGTDWTGPFIPRFQHLNITTANTLAAMQVAKCKNNCSARLLKGKGKCIPRGAVGCCPLCLGHLQNDPSTSTSTSRPDRQKLQYYTCRLLNGKGSCNQSSRGSGVLSTLALWFRALPKPKSGTYFTPGWSKKSHVKYLSQQHKIGTVAWQELNQDLWLLGQSTRHSWLLSIVSRAIGVGRWSPTFSSHSLLPPQWKSGTYFHTWVK